MTSTKRLKYKHGQHPNSLKNLRPGNPPVDTGEHGYSLTSALKHSLNKPLEVPALDAPYRDQIVYKTLKGAYDLVPVAFKETWERVEGKVLGDGSQGDTNIQINIYSSIPRPEYEVIEDATEG